MYLVYSPLLFSLVELKEKILNEPDDLAILLHQSL